MSDAEPLWFDELSLGMSMRSPARAVTEADIVAFAALSGDWNPMHSDAETAALGHFGQRVAHGLLGQAIASGLFTRTRLSQRLQPYLVPLLGIEWRFEAPILIGDTIHVDVEVTDLRSTHGGRGVVVLSRRVVNQTGVRVQSGTTTMLIRGRANADHQEPIR